MIPRTNHFDLVALLLAILAMAGCATAAPVSQPPAPPAVVDTSPEPSPTSTTPPEDMATSEAVATATFLPDPTATASLPPTVTPTALPTPTPATKPRAAVVANDFGEAPEIDTEVWINTEQPLRLEDLRGQVVLVDFWTYG